MFREDKATQMAARFLQLSGGRMSYLKLMKLLYMADKRMLLQWGKPIVYDRWVAMKYGPVLSATYNLIKDTQHEEKATYWASHIRTEGYDLVLSYDPGSDALSLAEDRIIESVYAEYGKLERWELTEMSQKLPEWEDPGDSSREITYRMALEVEGLPAEEIEAILDNIAAQDATELLMGTR